VEGYAHKTEANDAITISSETDRVYLDTTNTVEIHDRSLRRKIRIEKSGSNSTVLWNPWVAKAQQMPDFGDDEYQQMLCIESGNVGRNNIVLPSGHSSLLRVTLSSAPL
jgi:D-hexose-6-phosphate mutarotase